MIIGEDTIKVVKVQQSRFPEVDFENLVFGRIFSDHMFLMDYKEGKWQIPQILPFQNLSLSPSTSVLHYGQSIFEGLKAFRNEAGKVGIFRPDRNIKRMNKSAQRMCMPQIPEDIFMEALNELVSMDRQWIPNNEKSSLYIRPFLFATDEYVGVKPSESYRFMIFTCPVNAYYAKPVKVKIERHYTRAAVGGTGSAKAAGNYAGSLFPARLANQQGYDQLLWTDAKEHKYIEESGTMNVMFLINNKLITPALGDTILEGITRDSVLQLAREWGIEVEERKVAVDELLAALKNGEVQEAFGVGTAATIAHIDLIANEDEHYHLPDVEERVFSNKVAKYLVDLKRFKIEDKFNWMWEIK